MARVGTSYLFPAELEAALSHLPTGLDSLDASAQYIEQWVTNELLAQEARRRNLQNDPDVKRLIEASERSELISSLINELLEEIEIPSDAEIQTYFSENIDTLPLKEPFLRVRHLATADSITAERAREALLAIETGEVTSPDSLWQSVIRTFAIDTTGSMVLSSNYYAKSRLFSSTAALASELDRLRPGATSSVLKINDQYHIIQLVDRVRSGAKPQLDWVREEIINRLQIKARKQLYTDQVVRLRNEAIANGTLDMHTN